ncbi:MAG: transglycosylase family protein [Actinomycetota bacterium]|nr:transglycosylase family protein [Actinomycetota bacterium]
MARSVLFAHGKHRRDSGRRASAARSTSRRLAIATPGLAAILFAADAAAGAGAASAVDFAGIRNCESGGDYSTNTGNGFYGAYQFDLQTWRSVGGSGLPSSASAATQDALAARLASERGTSPWPVCGRGRGGGGSAPAARSYGSSSASSSSGSSTGSAARSGSAPAFQGTVLSTALVGSERGDVRQWQQRMADRGWGIAVDGRFGGQSAEVARAFEADKGLDADEGLVGPQVWSAAWERPVTHAV